MNFDYSELLVNNSISPDFWIQTNMATQKQLRTHRLWSLRCKQKSKHTAYYYNHGVRVTNWSVDTDLRLRSHGNYTFEGEEVHWLPFSVVKFTIVVTIIKIYRNNHKESILANLTLLKNKSRVHNFNHNNWEQWKQSACWVHFVRIWKCCKHSITWISGQVRIHSNSVELAIPFV